MINKKTALVFVLATISGCVATFAFVKDSKRADSLLPLPNAQVSMHPPTGMCRVDAAAGAIDKAYFGQMEAMLAQFAKLIGAYVPCDYLETARKGVSPGRLNRWALILVTKDETGEPIYNPKVERADYIPAQADYLKNRGNDKKANAKLDAITQKTIQKFADAEIKTVNGGLFRSDEFAAYSFGQAAKRNGDDRYTTFNVSAYTSYKGYRLVLNFYKNTEDAGELEALFQDALTATKSVFELEDGDKN